MDNQESTPTKHNPNALLTGTEAANYLGVHPVSVARWSREGKIAHYLTPGGRRRYRISDLDAALARWSR